MRSDKRYDALRRALEAGPTPGPWALWGLPNPSQAIASDEDAFIAQTVGGNDLHNGTFIAAANPDTIRSLIADYDALTARVEAAERDARRWQAFRHASGDLTLRLHNTRPDCRDAAIDAASGQSTEAAE